MILVCLSSLLGMSVLMLTMGAYSFQVYWGYFLDIRLVLLNTVPLFLLTQLLYAMIGRTWMALAVSDTAVRQSLSLVYVIIIS